MTYSVIFNYVFFTDIQLNLRKLIHLKYFIIQTKIHLSIFAILSPPSVHFHMIMYTKCILLSLFSFILYLLLQMEFSPLT